MSTGTALDRSRRRDRRRERRKSRPTVPAYRILQAIAYPILRFTFRVRAIGLESINKTSGPLILMGNHSSVIDPFIVAIFIRRPVQYVISDSQIRSRFLSWILGLVGVIPKTKVVADLDTVKRIMAVKRNNGIIGIFPEGQSSWDGHQLPIVKATDKLVKSLKVPVFIAQIRGAYFSWPRWGRRFRRGEVRIYYRQLFSVADLKNRTVEQVGDALREALTFDVFADQADRGTRYIGTRQAEYLERALFACPACGAFHTLRSERRRLSCTDCGYSVSYNSYGFFEARRGPLRFRTVREWNLWQLEAFRRSLAAAPTGKPFMVESAVHLQQGYKTLPLQSLGVGRLEYHREAIRFVPETGAVRKFPVNDIEGMNVQNNEHLEFYLYNTLYRISTVDPRGNTYKWDLATRYLQGLATEGRHTTAATEDRGVLA